MTNFFSVSTNFTSTHDLWIEWIVNSHILKNAFYQEIWFFTFKNSCNCCCTFETASTNMVTYVWVNTLIKRIVSRMRSKTRTSFSLSIVKMAAIVVRRWSSLSGDATDAVKSSPFVMQTPLRLSQGRWKDRRATGLKGRRRSQDLIPNLTLSVPLVPLADSDTLGVCVKTTGVQYSSPNILGLPFWVDLVRKLIRRLVYVATVRAFPCRHYLVEIWVYLFVYILSCL